MLGKFLIGANTWFAGIVTKLVILLKLAFHPNVKFFAMDVV